LRPSKRTLGELDILELETSKAHPQFVPLSSKLFRREYRGYDSVPRRIKARRVSVKFTPRAHLHRSHRLRTTSGGIESNLGESCVETFATDVSRAQIAYINAG
jgi:hypothetical protein